MTLFAFTRLGFGDTMVADGGVTDVQTLDSGHTPFLAHPKALARAIEAAAAR
jgi:hypothetical protein